MRLTSIAASMVAMIVAYLGIAGTAAAAGSSPGIKGFDITRYTGTWYEIARLPAPFEKGLTNVTATYTPLSNGKIEVVNRGFRGSAQAAENSIKGRAWIPDAQEPAHLKVSFFFFFAADYIVLDCDLQNYSWALVGSGDSFCWILSQTPVLDDTIYQNLINVAAKAGYDTGKFIRVPQVW